MTLSNAASSKALAASRPRALWSYAFRPFFLAAGLWSAFSVLLWIGMLLHGHALPSLFDPMAWHIHSMLFGFVYAAIAGFMLTAIATWTGRPRIKGALLAGLVTLWLLGRIVSLFSAGLPFWTAVAVELAFPLALAALVAREILLARNWRNAMMPVPILVLAAADFLSMLEAHSGLAQPGLGWRLAIAASLSLIGLIGGRIIPAFTRNWLVRQKRAAQLPVVAGPVDRAALATLQGGLIIWAFQPNLASVGVLLLVAGVCNLWRLARWRGLHCFAEPLLLILHLAYLWVGIGALLLGASILSAAIPSAAAVHALTAGAIGTMILAVMPRVSLGHTGRPIEADRVTSVSFLLILLSALLRVVAAFPTPFTMWLLQTSALLWAGAFLLFVLRYGRMLLQPRADA